MINTTKIQQLAKLKKQQMRFLICRLPKRYWKLEDKIIMDKGNKEALKLTKEFIDGKINGILFVGKAGTGKTLFAATILHKMQWKTARFVSVPRLLMQLRDSFKDPSKKTMQQIVDDLIKHELLILDDLGAEKTTDWTVEVLYLIINGRYEQNKKLIVTTNCSPSELEERLNDRIVSRLAEMCKMAKITSPDRRLSNWDK